MVAEQRHGFSFGHAASDSCDGLLRFGCFHLVFEPSTVGLHPDLVRLHLSVELSTWPKFLSPLVPGLTALGVAAWVEPAHEDPGPIGRLEGIEAEVFCLDDADVWTVATAFRALPDRQGQWTRLGAVCPLSSFFPSYRFSLAAHFFLNLETFGETTAAQ